MASKRIPVTDLKVNDDTDKIQFAIISDLWGGRRPGIFEDAVSKLELLQPQFVISVGDLIDGKTYDATVIANQWNEFNQDIKPLSMPFFYVPGNHDIGNAIMEEEWKKRLGSPYYHFVYKNVLFLSINTEDGGHGGIQNEQVNYFKNAIENNPDVRWTFLFMHRPVWQGANDKQEGYEKIEAFLKGKNYTLFSGHHHTYLSVNKNGNKHFVLGSTGGGSDLRGEKFGEFDHLTLVTFTKGEPKIVNLKLDGIIKEDIVNEITHSITETLIDEVWMTPIPFVSQYQMEHSIPAEIALNNPTDFPLKVSGHLCKGNGYDISPCNILLTIPPHGKFIQPVVISKTDHSDINLAQLPSVDIVLKGEYQYKGESYSIPAEKKLLLSWKMLPGSFTSDTTRMIAITSPEQLDRKWFWSGADDGLIRFKVMKDKKYFYLRTIITDDQWVTGQADQEDLLYLHLEDSKGGQNYISSSPAVDNFLLTGKGSIIKSDIKLKRFSEKESVIVEYKIPLQKLLKSDGTVRINIGYRDQDNKPEKQYSILYWKPVWGSAEDYKNSGAFLFQ